MSFTTRLATASDHPAFARLFPELGVADPLPGAERFSQHMLPRVLLLCEDAQPVAYAFWQVHGRTAHVVQVVVDPRTRGRGAGRALLEALRSRLTSEGFARWYLNVKRDNVPALRLYERCGFHPELEVYALRLAWSRLDALPGAGSCVAFTPEPSEDAALASRLSLEPERIAHLRARPGQVLVALREEGAPVALAAFDPGFPRAYPFRVARPELARPLLDALQAHAHQERFDFVHLVVEGDRTLKDALLAAGAELSSELMQLGAALSDGG